MKAIEIPKAFENELILAAQSLHLEIEKLKSSKSNDKALYNVVGCNSQYDLFRLGFCFAKFTANKI